MCLIVYYNPAQHTAQPDRDILRRGNRQNADGAGLLRLNQSGAWARERRLGLTDRQLDRWLEDCMESGRQWAIHFRWSTGGGVSKNNCHPFDLGGGRFLMHNGTLAVSPTTTASDTAVFSAWIKRHGLGDKIRQGDPMVEAIRRGSRLLIAEPGGSVQLWGEWHHETHGSYSNKNCHWAPAPKQTVITYTGAGYSPGAYSTRAGVRGSLEQSSAAPALVGEWCPDRLCYVDPQGICRRYNTASGNYIIVPDPRPGLPRPGFSLIAPKYQPISQLGNHTAADEFWQESTDRDIPDLADLIDDSDEWTPSNCRRPWNWK